MEKDKLIIVSKSCVVVEMLMTADGNYERNQWL